jgi:hypothetical protein
MRDKTSSAEALNSSPLDDEKTPGELIERRIHSLSRWLRENGPECTEEQAHLSEGTRERLYWHYGYLVALRDLKRLLESNRTLVN